MSREIYLIRHGQTEYNKRGIVQGRGVDSSLDETGQEQARHFYNHFKNEGFDHIFVSSLKRTYESVAAFIDQGNAYSKHKELDEIDWGEHEGQAATDALRAHYSEVVGGWAEGKLDRSIAGGESPLEVQERIRDFLAHYQKEGPAKSLIACHGRTMRVFLCTMLEKNLTEMDSFPHRNLTLYKLEENSGVYRLVLANDTTHLDGLT